MPQLIVPPGLGDSLDRYLERLGRRGEEQRRLQQQRDFVQAEMDQRASELRTKLISDSINQGVGLFTDEMQRDRASQRRMAEGGFASERKIEAATVLSGRKVKAATIASGRKDEAAVVASDLRFADKERLQYLEGLPGRVRADTYFGLQPRVHNGPLEFIDERYGLGRKRSEIVAHLENHPNYMTQGETDKVNVFRGIAQELEKTLLADGRPNKKVEGDYVKAMIQALEPLNFEPSGPTKKKPKEPNTIIGNGFGPGNNGGFPGVLYNVHPETGKMDPVDFPEGFSDGLKDIRKDVAAKWTKEWGEWDLLGDTTEGKATRGPEPQKHLDDEDQAGLILIATEKLLEQYGAAYNNVDPRLAAEKMRDVAKKYEEPADPVGESVPYNAHITQLDEAFKKAGRPIIMTDETGHPKVVLNNDKQESYAWYLGGGKIELHPIGSGGGLSDPILGPY